MQIQPIVIGTAGHIDHGKSTLVQALTGIDPDRLKEEKERGLTIDLGFASLELPDGRVVGLVDVPGHERFIRNMVAGATGIDLVLLVVAADDGVMPQTREHLQIMELLGVGRGFVALTKIDKVDHEMIELAEEDIAESTAGTFLEGAPILRVSAKTGEGMDALKDVLFAAAGETQPRPADGVFRMPVQRVFSKRGFGTVVTGIPVSGEAKLGDTLEVLPGNVRGKVRGLNAYKQATESVRAGHSSAINFSDVNQDAVERGHVIAKPGFFTPQRMVAARLSTLQSLDRPVTNRMPIRLHTGTADAPGELVLLDCDEILPGDSGLVQLRLETPVVVAPGDRFVLRLLSPVVTLGGGAILEESRYRLKRFKGFVLEELGRQEQSLASPEALLESMLARRGDELVTTEDLAVAIKRSKPETVAFLEALRDAGRVIAPRTERWIHADRLDVAAQKLRQAIDRWFDSAPHRTMVDVLELRKLTGFDSSFLDVLLERAAQRDELEVRPGGRVRPAGRTPELGDEERRRCEAALARLTVGRFQPPLESALAEELGISEKNMRRTLEYLVDEGQVVRVGGDLFLARSSVDEARDAVTENCERNGQLEIPELRDRLGTTRKFLIPVLEYFDAQGLTLRQAGHRILRRR